MLRYNWITVAALAAVAGTATAQDRPINNPREPENPSRQGTRGANFLTIGVGARAAGMAGAVAASEQGPTSWYWNPAGNASTEQFSVVADRQELYRDLDISMNYAAISLPTFGGVVGLHFTSLTSGDLERTSETNPEGGVFTGSTFTWSSTAVGVGYARRLTDRLALGTTVKFVGEGITDARVSWVALDAGTRFRTGVYGLTLGASIANVGPRSRMRGPAVNRAVNTDEFAPQIVDVNLDTREQDMPTLFRFSVQSDLLGGAESILRTSAGRSRLIGEVEFSDANQSNPQIAGGLEYSFADIFFLRGGQRYFNDQRNTTESNRFGLSGGAGIRFPIRGRGLQFDYAYTSMGELENVQVFTFSFGR